MFSNKESYFKALNYLKASHAGPKIIASVDLIPPTNNESNIDIFMRTEIDKFNKLKRFKQVCLHNVRF